MIPRVEDELLTAADIVAVFLAAVALIVTAYLVGTWTV